MRRYLIILIIWPLLLGAARAVLVGDGVTIYSNGTSVSVASSDECLKKMTDAGIELLKTANDSHRLLVTPDLINNIRKKERAVEIIVVTPQQINGQNVSKFLIPLTGQLATGYTTIFYGTPEYDDVNQAINSVNQTARKTLESCTQKFSSK
jgi:hypothetical protein